jgi:PAS domain-containing protein
MADGQEHLVELTEPRLCGDFLVSTTPLRDATGAIVGSVHVARDITARKRVEADLKVSNRRLDLLAETADALLKTDAPQAAIAAQGRKLLDFLGCDVFFNFVAEEGRPDLRLNAHAGIPAEDMQQVRCTDCGVIIDGQATQSACPNFPRTPVSADGSKPAGGPTFGVANSRTMNWR